MSQNNEVIEAPKWTVAEMNKQLSKAKINFMLKDNAVFLANLCSQLDVLIDNKIPTACTNGAFIKFNTNFFMELDIEQQIFIFAHETLHVAYTHMCRIEGRQPMIWNMAADYAINLLLKDNGFKVLDSALIDEKYRDMTAEQIYNDLLEDPDLQEKLEQFEKDNGSDLDGSGDTNEGGSSEQKRRAMEASIQDKIIKANTQTQMQGKDAGLLPADIKRMLDELMNPKLDPAELLRKFLYESNKTFYSWKSPNRKHYAASGGRTYLPSISQKDKRLAHITFAIDVSGSIDDTQFKELCSIVYASIKELSPDVINLVQWDTEMCGDDVINDIDDLLKVKFNGGGGTDPRVAFDQFSKHGDSKAMVVLTDGYFSDYEYNEARPIIWCVYDNPDFKAPIGEVVHFSLSDYNQN